MKIAVFGAGATGCYLGAQLALCEFSATLIGRQYLLDQILQNDGISITDYLGNHNTVMPEKLLTEPDGEIYDLIFVTLKGHHLSAAAEALLSMSDEHSLLLFMQNGLGSFDAIAEAMQSRQTRPGITQFNVIQQPEGGFHKATEGDYILPRTAATEVVQKHFHQNGFDMTLAEDMQPVMYGKMLLNLNNALNAIADQPIRQTLQNRHYRRLLAAAMSEWLSVCAAEGIQPAQLTAVKPHLLPRILRLPNWMFRLLAAKMLAIDPTARSSMWADIQAGGKTEIEFLNQAVVHLGQTHQVATPVNARITALIQRLEQGAEVSLNELIPME